MAKILVKISRVPGSSDYDLRFYNEDNTPIVSRYGFKRDGDEYHMGQISSSVSWAKHDAENHFKEELQEMFPEGYSLNFEVL